MSLRRLLDLFTINMAVGKEVKNEHRTRQVLGYLGVIPFIFIQIILLVILYKFPELITWLPKKL